MATINAKVHLHDDSLITVGTYPSFATLDIAPKSGVSSFELFVNDLRQAKALESAVGELVTHFELKQAAKASEDATE